MLRRRRQQQTATDGCVTHFRAADGVRPSPRFLARQLDHHRLFMGAPPISTSFLVRQAVDAWLVEAFFSLSQFWVGLVVPFSAVEQEPKRRDPVPEGERSKDVVKEAGHVAVTLIPRT
jgi:hypothetical protein